MQQMMTAASLYACSSTATTTTQDFPNFPLDKRNRKRTVAELYSDNEAFGGFLCNQGAVAVWRRKCVA